MRRNILSILLVGAFFVSGCDEDIEPMPDDAGERDIDRLEDLDFVAPAEVAAPNCLWDCMDLCVTDLGWCTSECDPDTSCDLDCLHDFGDCRRTCRDYPCPLEY
jgi:hypothetical protein